MTVNKHKIMQEYVQQFLTDNYLYYHSADVYPNARMIVPQYGEFTLKTDIVGNKYKRYTFAFVGYEQLDNGTSDVNADTMNKFDLFNEWVLEQEKDKNYPDFGENVTDYEIKPLQNMANLALVDEQGIAKYMLAIQLNYVEKEN